MARIRLNVSTRFWLVLIIGCVFQACISLASLPTLRHLLMNDRQVEVKHLVETAYSVVTFYHDEAQRGLISDAAARKSARDFVRAMRYDDTNYFFIWTLDGTSIAHGAHPEWEGRRFIHSADAVKYPGVSHMVARLIDVARSEKHEGVTTYRIPKLAQTVPLDKIAYSRYFAPWGWSIGTGAYVDDINTTFRSQVVSLIVLFVCLIVVAGVITFLLGRNLTRALKSLSARVESVAQGEFEADVPEVQRSDEVGVMARALLILRGNSQAAIALLTLDHLTGLPNRKLLVDRLGAAMATSSRNGKYCGLLLLDLDKFKALNDTQGHDTGDMLLREVAQRLKACIRESDTVARLGGDEFVVIIEDINRNEQEAAAALETIAVKLLGVLSAAVQLRDLTYMSSASIGMSLFQGHATAVEDVLKQADLAMYKAKESGRNACSFFDPSMEAAVRKRAALESDLLVAIAENQFELYYQAQVGSQGQLKGAEALIR